MLGLTIQLLWITDILVSLIHFTKSDSVLKIFLNKSRESRDDGPIKSTETRIDDEAIKSIRKQELMTKL